MPIFDLEIPKFNVTEFVREWRPAIAKFLFDPASARPIAALRIGVSLVLLVQAFLLRHDILALCASDGYIQPVLSSFNHRAPFPAIDSLTQKLSSFGMTEHQVIIGLCAAYLCSIASLLAGSFSRPAAFIAWLTHGILMNSSAASIYGVDYFAQVFLLYFFVFPSGAAWSLDVLSGRISSAPTWQARLGLRTMQINLCIAYLATGLEKAAGYQWWHGEVMMRVAQLPIYKGYDLTWIANFPLIALLAGWATLFFEIGYIVFIWPRHTRTIWAFSIVGLHLGIIALMGLGIFGAFMAIMTPALFLVSAEDLNDEPVAA
jgi:Vitamin K-dependent gamma-carboxylase